jgi:hypothetical protein
MHPDQSSKHSVYATADTRTNKGFSPEQHEFDATAINTVAPASRENVPVRRRRHLSGPSVASVST